MVAQHCKYTTIHSERKDFMVSELKPKFFNILGEYWLPSTQYSAYARALYTCSHHLILTQAVLDRSYSHITDEKCVRNHNTCPRWHPGRTEIRCRDYTELKYIWISNANISKNDLNFFITEDYPYPFYCAFLAGWLQLDWYYGILLFWAHLTKYQ